MIGVHARARARVRPGNNRMNDRIARGSSLGYTLWERGCAQGGPADRVPSRACARAKDMRDRVRVGGVYFAKVLAMGQGRVL